MAIIAPHGGTLVKAIVSEQEKKSVLAEAQSLVQLSLDGWEVSDIEMLGIGAYSPLRGFMTKEQYTSVVERMRLPNGLAWTVPITLAVPPAQADTLKTGQRVALVDAARQPVAVLTVSDRWRRDRVAEASAIFRTTDPAHPGVARTLQASEVLVGGNVQVLHHTHGGNFPEYRLEPSQTRAAFEARGWSRVVGFQTRNPVHRAHEYLLKCALEIVDGLLLHPLVGETKSDDIPADVRMKCYEVLLKHYFPSDRVILAVNPAAMRYGGPREAIFHAIVRQNYGCSHFIVGRDHAGVGNYYGTYDAQKIFDEFTPEELRITPLKFEHSFFCKRTGGMATTKTSPSSPEERVTLSGTKVREMLTNGQIPPPEFTRPEIARILIEAYQREGATA